MSVDTRLAELDLNGLGESLPAGDTDAACRMPDVGGPA